MDSYDDTSSFAGAPEWANFKTVNEDGSMMFHEKEPRVGTLGRWESDGRTYPARAYAWEYSKYRRR